MRCFQIMGATVVLAIASLVPAVAHATTYSRFSSTICPYSIDYPSNWQATGAKTKSGHDLFDGGKVAMAISCLAKPAGMTLSRLMAQEKKSYTSSGYTLTGASTNNGVIRLNMTKGGAHDIFFGTFTGKLVVISFAAGQDLQSYKAYENVFVHMQNSMKFK